MQCGQSDGLGRGAPVASLSGGGLERTQARGPRCGVRKLVCALLGGEG